MDGDNYWLAVRTTCTRKTGAPGTLIKTGQSRSLAKNVPCILPSSTRLPERAAAGVRQEYPCPASWMNSQKPRNIAVHAMKARRLLFLTDVGSHQATNSQENRA
ncbi:uncharacterized protein LOC108165071 [Drosophila miranda]|uniref:uncharacterized protein LOC108165071 n=1 Tax=Drosophila miranda TaxID=7229 RepID=UPI00143F26AB|nr:uncharacterized protein LOC108165071 [Drosophila miranda]